jgi:hypothetical protein
MWFETKQRIIEILKTLGDDPVTNTHCTVADSIPFTRSDHHGYVILVKPSRDSVQAPVTADTRTHVLNFAIECYSPQVLTNTPIVQEYRIEAYADVITALIERYPRLESVPTDVSPGRVGLTGVQGIFVSGSIFQTPRAYPDGQTAQVYYSVTVNLQVTFDRATGC